MDKLQIPIKGMHCASCAKIIEKRLNKLDGVKQANVNLATEKAFVVYDPSKLGIGRIHKTISDAGFTPVRETSKKQDKLDEDMENLKIASKKMWFSWIFTALIMYIMIPEMFFNIMVVRVYI